MKKRYGCYALMLYTLFLIKEACSANLKLTIEGISDDLQRNIHACLARISEDHISTDIRLKHKLNDTVRNNLRSIGYYDPKINFEYEQSTMNNSQDILTMHINPGQPVKIVSINVGLYGEAKQDRDYLEWIKNGKLALGRVLTHYAYDQFKNGLYDLALQKGYFDAFFLKSQLEVAPSRHQAYWNIDFDSGSRYRFNDFKIHGSQIRKDYIYNLSKVRVGDLYNAESLAMLNRRLAETNWFNSIIISTNFPTDTKNHTLILNVLVTPHTRNGIEIGVGYATDIGPRVTTTWNKPWINSRGHSIQTNFSVLLSEQLIDITYKIPLIKNPLEQYYLLQGGFKHANLNDSRSYSNILNIARYWDLSHGWKKVINLRWSLDHFIQANFSNTTMLIYPGISMNRTRQRGGLMPIWGDTQRYSIDVSNTILGSNINFIIFQMQTTWIRPIKEKHRFVARGHLGWISTNDFSRVPPPLRFFAGGDRSIRGYKYKSLSPWVESRKLIGASKLATGSLEYQYNFYEKWWGAIFIDSGEAIHDIKYNNFKTGAGIGIRWQSFVGPIKLDIATPITKDAHKYGVQFYIGLGAEL